MTETISVIVPCYRVEPYLPRCVDSILRQTHRSLEVILVDDGSPDRSGEIGDDYAAVDERVRVIHQPNRGLSAARNAGLEVMTGQYVTFVDGDDWLADTCIETLYKMLVDTDADLSVCNLLRTSDEEAARPPISGTIIELDRGQAMEQIIKPRHGSMVAACGKLYHSNSFDQVRFPVGRLHEDAFTTYRIILHAHKVVLTTAPLYFYWQRPDSIMGSPFNPKAKLDIIDALTERARVLRAEGMEAAARTTSGQVLATFMEVVRHAAASPADPAVRTVPVRALARRLLTERQPLRLRAFYSLTAAWPSLALRAYAVVAGPTR